MELSMSRHKESVQRVALKYLAPSTVLLLIVSLFRFYIGYLFEVVALTIEGLHILIDFVMTIMVIVALLVVYSQYAKRFPYGLFKIEDLIALFLSILTLYSAFTIITESLKISNIPQLRVEPLVVQGITVPIILLSAYLKKLAGDALRSPSLKADATHTIVDVIESLAVLGGLLLYYLTSSSWIYYLTLGIAGLGLIITSLEVSKSSLFALLDLPRDRKMMHNIKLEVKKLRDDIEVVDARARWAGSVMFLEITIRLHPLITIEDSYLIVREVTDHILSKYEEVEDVVIKVEPTKRKSFTLALPQDKPDLNECLSNHFGRAKFFTIVQVKENRLINVEYLHNPYVKAKRQNIISRFLVGANIAEMLHKRGITDVITLNIGEIAFSILLRHGILIWSGKDSMAVSKLIEEFIKSISENKQQI